MKLLSHQMGVMDNNNARKELEMSERTYQRTDFAEIRVPFPIDGKELAALIDVLVILLKLAKLEGARGDTSLSEFARGVWSLVKGPEHLDESLRATAECLVDHVEYRLDVLSRRAAGGRQRPARVSGVTVSGQEFTVGVVAGRPKDMKLEFFAFVRWGTHVSPDRIGELFETARVGDDLLAQLVPSEDLRGWLSLGGKMWFKPRRNTEMPEDAAELEHASVTVS